MHHYLYDNEGQGVSYCGEDTLNLHSDHNKRSNKLNDNTIRPTYFDTK